MNDDARLLLLPSPHALIHTETRKPPAPTPPPSPPPPFPSPHVPQVLPALQEKQGEYMLKELVRRWDNHKIMVRWLSRFFNYLDRYYIQRHNLAQLKDVGMLCFRDLVFAELKKSVKDAVLQLVDKERDGEQVDRALVRRGGDRGRGLVANHAKRHLAPGGLEGGRGE